jgi:hypothetical protein
MQRSFSQIEPRYAERMVLIAALTHKWLCVMNARHVFTLAKQF